MKRSIKLTGIDQRNYAYDSINNAMAEGVLHDVEIKPTKESKTMQQLRGLFGTWYTYLSNTLGESKDDLHTDHKNDFLRLIYIENPEGIFQDMWVELLQKVVEKGKPEAIIKHLNRISLSWATVDQMREYMTRIEHHYINAGYPLPILEKFQRVYTR